jgi:hypothetical protein
MSWKMNSYLEQGTIYQTFKDVEPGGASDSFLFNSTRRDYQAR